MKRTPYFIVILFLALSSTECNRIPKPILSWSRDIVFKVAKNQSFFSKAGTVTVKLNSYSPGFAVVSKVDIDKNKIKKWIETGYDTKMSSLFLAFTTYLQNKPPSNESYKNNFSNFLSTSEEFSDFYFDKSLGKLTLIFIPEQQPSDGSGNWVKDLDISDVEITTDFEEVLKNIPIKHEEIELAVKFVEHGTIEDTLQRVKPNPAPDKIEPKFSMDSLLEDVLKKHSSYKIERRKKGYQITINGIKGMFVRFEKNKIYKINKDPEKGCTDFDYDYFDEYGDGFLDSKKGN